MRFMSDKVFTVPLTTEMIDTIIFSFVFGLGRQRGSIFEERRFVRKERKRFSLGEIY
jgi:hypothetical protein